MGGCLSTDQREEGEKTRQPLDFSLTVTLLP